jgi:hypothetical protein
VTSCAGRVFSLALLLLPLPLQAQPLPSQTFSGEGFSAEFPLAAPVERQDKPLAQHSERIAHYYFQGGGGFHFGISSFVVSDKPDAFSSRDMDQYAKILVANERGCVSYSQISSFPIAGGQGRQFHQWSCLPPALEPLRMKATQLPPRENRGFRFVVSGNRGFIISYGLPSDHDTAMGEKFLASFKLDGK